MDNDSKGLRQIEDFYSLSQSGTSRKKIACTKKVYEIDHVEICLLISSISLTINLNKAGKTWIRTVSSFTTFTCDLQDLKLLWYIQYSFFLKFFELWFNAPSTWSGFCIVGRAWGKPPQCSPILLIISSCNGLLPLPLDIPPYILVFSLLLLSEHPSSLACHFLHHVMERGINLILENYTHP